MAAANFGALAGFEPSHPKSDLAVYSEMPLSPLTSEIAITIRVCSAPLLQPLTFSSLTSLPAVSTERLHGAPHQEPLGS